MQKVKKDTKRKSNSVVENLSSKVLDSIGVEYEREKTMEGMVHKKSLRFDFWFPNHGIAIEIDGKEHQKAAEGDVRFIDLRVRDKIKDKYSEENNIKLIRIPHNVKGGIAPFLRKTFAPQDLAA